MKANARLCYIVATVAVCSVLMSLVDGIWKPDYALKSTVKIVLFLVIPALYFLVNKEDRVALAELFRPKKRTLLRALLLGVALYALIVGAYFVLRGTFDFSGITDSLTKDIGVNADNFIWVALYISFINSLLEEFFFRGFGFLALRTVAPRGFAYCFSAVLFSAYHVGMTIGWFHPALYVLALVGLFVGGCIFNRLNEKDGNIYTSWLVHMFANFAINTIGCILFGVF